MTNINSIPYAGHDPVWARDAEHLKLLVIFHYIVAAFIALFSCLFIAYIYTGVQIAAGKASMATVAPADAAATGASIIVIGSICLTIGWLMALLTLVSARFIAHRRARWFGIIVSAINCAFFPFGTAMGFFTILVLARDSVKMQYGAIPARSI